MKPTLAEIRRAVADYMSSEGCSCCQDLDAHEKHKAVLGKLLRMKRYSDDSGYDYSAHTTKAAIKRPTPRPPQGASK